MWKYPNVSPVLLRQCSKNSVGNPQMKVLEKCLFCNILYASKWGNNGEEGGDSSFFSVSLSIQITTKCYPSLFLNIPPAHSLPIPAAIVFIQACYWSLLTALLLSVFPLGRSSRKKKKISSMDLLTWKHLILNHTTSFFFPLLLSYFFLSSPLAELAFRKC